MLFMYWTGTEPSTSPAAAAWRTIYPAFRVFRDPDVLPLLSDRLRPIYERIQIPAAKSDLARLVLLRRYGGLYLDSHVGPTAPEHLLQTIERLSEYNMILFGKGWSMTSETDFDLMNGVIAARKSAPELDIVIGLLEQNLIDQWIKENNTIEYMKYNLFDLTGTHTLIQSYFDQIPPRPKLKAEFSESIFIHFMKDNMSSGFELASHYSYRKPGRHWSERQTTERLFGAYKINYLRQKVALAFLEPQRTPSLMPVSA